MKTAIPRWPKVREAEHKNGSKAWMVDARINGVGERLFFKTKREADTKADALRTTRANHGTAALGMSEAHRAEAARCIENLSAAGATLTDATNYFLKHARPAGGQKTVADLVTKFLKDKTDAGLRPDYLSVQKYVLSNVFAGRFGEQLVHEVSHQEIAEWMAGQAWAVRTRRNYHNDLSTLFAFAIARGYCASNPLAKLTKPKVTPKPPGIFTVAQAEALLAAAGVGDGAMLPAIAIGLFCGLRSAELERLDWQYVRLDLGTIEVTAEAAKMSERRVIKMPQNLQRWLLPYAKPAGLVAPTSFAFRLAKVATAAGIAKWPKNAMRHSAASYHYAHHDSLEKVTALLGHFGNTRTFINSYRGLVQPSEAAKYWELSPSASKTAKIVRMVA